LVDRNGGRKPVDTLDVGLFHLPQELTGVRRQAFYVPSLPFGKNGVERERGFPTPRKPRKDGELVSWKTLDPICALLDCQPGDLVEFVAGE
jgi:hypothetical protein